MPTNPDLRCEAVTLSGTRCSLRGEIPYDNGHRRGRLCSTHYGKMIHRGGVEFIDPSQRY